jgi:hypothetical protein
MIAPGTGGSIRTLTINSSIIGFGNYAFNVNKSLTQSNDLVIDPSTIVQVSSGTLTVTNLGPGLVVGDKFTLFSPASSISNAAPMLTISGAGATWSNNLAIDGSIIALTVSGSTVNTNRPVMQVSVSGGNLNLGWPTNLGWTLQTNSVGLLATNQWFSYPGSASLTNVSIPINPANTNVFFRLKYP